MSELFREKLLPKAVALGLGAALLASCSETEPDTTPANDLERQFMEEAGALILSKGETGFIPSVPTSLRDEYEELHVVSQKSGINNNNRDNFLTFKPNRYKTGFSRGDGNDGDKPDSICEDLRIKEDTEYVFIVQNSNYDTWAAYEDDGSELHICYNSTSKHPSDIAAWGSNDPR